MDEATEQQRIPGVKYRKVRLHRQETTVIDGVPSTRTVPYDGWEPVPPREWDDLILRGVTGVAVGFTAVAVAGGTASLGGLLDPLVPSVIAYGMGSVFAVAWMFCLAIEWLNRTAPDRARPAKIAGWFFLLLSMGAVAAYGHTLHQPWAGGFGAFVDVVAKGAWWLLLREYAVPLDAGVAHWVQDQEQKLAGRALLGARVRRLNRRAAYQRAVGGAEYQAAEAILASAEAARNSLPAPAAEPTPAPVAAPAPAPAVVQAAAPTTPVVPAPAPAPVAQAPVPTVTISAPSAPPATAPGSEQQAPAAAPAAPAEAPVPPATETPAPPALRAVGGPFKSDTIRAALAADPQISDEALIQRVNEVHGEDEKNVQTVPRTRRRIEDKLKKKKAS
ncbi:hypothetical protein J7E96_28375 [Streptomyces sp. ISL-96]|uniref:hypothetical protein n=1 Tax=Streptomyces sp. ISL-96 TaxID=2819191 RepID=UPI001BE7C2F8|nr:hypothetical protein [Streptomyces sp. ISL-96]MBT2492357.1 hypothetical protein [Streptomyces sp. ISL-96]